MSEPNSPATQPWPQSLLALLERQQTIVNQLAALAQSQSSLIAERHTDRLLALLSKRQSLIDAFTGSQQDLQELTQDIDLRLRTAAPAQRDRIKHLIDDIGERLAQVMQRDEQDQGLLRANRDGIKQELAGVGTAGKARAAYLGPSTKSSRFADQRG